MFDYKCNLVFSVLPLLTLWFLGGRGGRREIYQGGLWFSFMLSYHSFLLTYFKGCFYGIAGIKGIFFLYSNSGRSIFFLPQRFSLGVKG